MNGRPYLVCWKYIFIMTFWICAKEYYFGIAQHRPSRFLRLFTFFLENFLSFAELGGVLKPKCRFVMIRIFERIKIWSNCII